MPVAGIFPLYLFSLLKQLHEFEFVEALAQVGVVSVLDGVVGAAIDLLSDVAPTVAVHQVQFDDQKVFFHGPLSLADIRVQVVVPALATLLTDAPRQAFGDMGPVAGARRRDNLREDLVLLLGPRALRKVTAIVQLQPARVALNLRFSGQKFTDTIPAVLTESVDVIYQFLVLYINADKRAVRPTVKAVIELLLTSAAVHWMQYLGCFFLR